MTQLTEREAGDILRLAAADAPPGQAGPYAARALLEAAGVGVGEEMPEVSRLVYGQEAKLSPCGSAVISDGRHHLLGSVEALGLSDAVKEIVRLNRATLVAGYNAACRALAEIERCEVDRRGYSLGVRIARILREPIDG